MNIPVTKMGFCAKTRERKRDNGEERKREKVGGKKRRERKHFIYFGFSQRFQNAIGYKFKQRFLNAS